MIRLDCGWAGRALDVVSGDLHVIASFPGGALIALIDGLGHGPEAADAAISAAAVLEAHAAESVTDLVHRCHEGVRRTRGVVMSLASFSFERSAVTWVGVGNVAGVLLHRRPIAELPDRGLSVRAGVVGYQLPPLRAETFTISPGDTLIFTTDGIRDGFVANLDRDMRPQELAEVILARYARGTDDAHAVVARTVEAPP
jgi:hypothetical protein